MGYYHFNKVISARKLGLGEGMMRHLILSILMIAVGSPAALGASLFAEDFEGGSLGAFTGKGGGAHHGTIVSDPLEADKALSFTSRNSNGDIFSTAVVAPAGTYVLSFDYLGLAVPGSVPGNLGGFIGISEGLPGSHRWLQGTALSGGAEDDALIDDGSWHHYDVTFTSAFPFRIMIEDFSGSGGVAGDAYFDNIRISNVPIPAALPLFLGAMAGLGMLGWRRRAAPSA